MKTCVKTIFILLGSVIGAGFISGRELVRFFGDAFLPFLVLATLLFAVYLLLLLRAGNRCGGFDGFCKRAFGRKAHWVEGVFYVCSFVVAAAMLAGINALEESYAPFIALLSALFCFLITQKGIGGVGAFNLFLVPVILIYLFVCLFQKGEFALAQTSSDPGMDALFCLLYVAMNVFLSASVVMDCGAALEKKYFVPTAVIAAAVIGGCMTTALAAVTAEPLAKESAMPLLYVLERSGIFSLISYFGIVTTLISSYYPLHTALEGCKRKNAARLLVLGAASVCSLLGLKEIVEVAYPLIGGLGVVFLSVCVFYDDFFQKGYRKIHHRR